MNGSRPNGKNRRGKLPKVAGDADNWFGVSGVKLGKKCQKKKKKLIDGASVRVLNG